ncbi:unnamed protein product [Eruca vesicaria subsp. sativa]|uniref:Uncharacterized protein n=1 Tax=Eruca vesicaria subsp. sativa TaxID=29727 RepID=A0ABC8JLV4_ERUVS|nr:unnamed protein product [Eruca vesicaria subsp. sativa]
MKRLRSCKSIFLSSPLILTESSPFAESAHVRAMIVSFIVSILFTFVVMNLNLTTGIIPSLNISAGLLSFFFMKTCTEILNKAVILKQLFTRHETEDMHRELLS